MESDKFGESLQEPPRQQLAQEEIQSKTSSSTTSTTPKVVDDGDDEEGGEEKGNEIEVKRERSRSRSPTNALEIIMEELKNIKRQNSVTHGLLKAMIVITLAWQLSEVSLILKIKQGFSNPLKSLAGIIGSFFPKRQQVEPPSLPVPSLKIPDLPYWEFIGSDTTDNDDDDDDD